MTAAKGPARLPVVFAYKALRQFRLAVEILGIAEGTKNLQELSAAWPAHQHLVLNSAQKGFIAQALWTQVRREHKERFKGHRDLAAASKSQVVDPAFHRNNPSVQNLRRRGFLPSEVIDQVNPVVRLHLKRRVVNLRSFIEAQIQHLQRKLAAAHNEGAPALEPTTVERRSVEHQRRLRLFYRLVV